MVDRDDPLGTGFVEHLPQQCLAFFDRAAPQIVAVEIEQVESEVGQAIGPALAKCVLQPVDMRDATLVRDGDLTIKHDGPTARGKAPEWRAEEGGAIMAVPAEKF